MGRSATKFQQMYAQLYLISTLFFFVTFTVAASRVPWASLQQRHVATYVVHLASDKNQILEMQMDTHPVPSASLEAVFVSFLSNPLISILFQFYILPWLGTI